MSSVVLCVEDNRLNMQVMRHVVKRLDNVSFREAVTAEQGLEIAMTEAVDLIIMDIQLPGMDGFEALQRLREHEGTRHIPVVALSSYAGQADIERGRAAGFDEYVTKPIRVAHFLDLLERMLGIRQRSVNSLQEPMK